LDIVEVSSACSSPALGKHEPIDFFGNRMFLFDRLARVPERVHYLVEISIGQACQERVRA
jgi:hypothetical protein